MSEPTDPREGTPLQRALSDIVRERLTASAMTQADAAAFVGVSEKHLSRILNGRDEGTLTMWQRLLDFVDGDLADVKATARAKGAAEERSKAFSLQHTKPIRAAVSDVGVDAHNRAVKADAGVRLTKAVCTDPDCTIRQKPCYRAGER